LTRLEQVVFLHRTLFWPFKKALDLNLRHRYINIPKWYLDLSEATVLTFSHFSIKKQELSFGVIGLSRTQPAIQIRHWSTTVGRYQVTKPTLVPLLCILTMAGFLNGSENIRM
jgi:hypothetical protein